MTTPNHNKGQWVDGGKFTYCAKVLDFEESDPMTLAHAVRDIAQEALDAMDDMVFKSYPNVEFTITDVSSQAISHDGALYVLISIFADEKDRNEDHVKT